MSKMIAFVCAADGHAKPKPERGTPVLTIHGGRWAVCRTGHEDGHRWQETPGLRYEEIFVGRPAPERAS